MKGIIKFYHYDGKYGFIKFEEGAIFFSLNDSNLNPDEIYEGLEVTFSVAIYKSKSKGYDRKKAVNVRKAD